MAAAFDKSEVNINVANFPCEESSLDPEEILDLAVRAVDQFWNRVPTSRLRLRRGSILILPDAFNENSVCSDPSSSSCSPNPDLIVSSDILITCNTSDDNFAPNSGVLAISVPNNISGRDIKGAIVVLNDEETTRLKNQSPAELKAILAHEIGHAIGLGHSPVKDSLMYYTLVNTRTRLGWDDIDGVTYLYPKEQPVSCGTIRDVTKNTPQTWWGLFAFIIALGPLLAKFQRQRLKAKA